MKINNIQPNIFYSPQVNAIAQQGASSMAMAGQLAAIKQPYTLEGPYHTQKVVEAQKAQKTYETSIKPLFLELTSFGVKKINAGSGVSAGANVLFLGNTDKALSNLRGELAKNVPLKGDAVYFNGGFSGGRLNIIS